ncbi:DoxX family membrane protein [Streptomyces sp. NPDC002039]|uniref:DoxX family protein n=1 Tax=Streptomyces sp. NPDC002039 TaxID=3154660 RepID=UPI003324434A
MDIHRRKDLGLLALRLGAGGVLMAHGTQKLFGWFGGGGLDGTAKAMEHMGFVPGRPSALAAGLGEAGGGALLALGLATPAAGAAAAGAMAGAVSVHAPAGFFAQGGGFEYPAFLGYVAAGLGLAGPGRYSVDHFTRHRLDRPAVLVVAFALSAAAATVVVGRRNAALAAAAAPDATSGGDPLSGVDA